jgi:hypothetical protein
MKVIYNASDRLQFELEGSGQKEIFKELAIIQEIFSEHKCGMCNKDDIKFIVRNIDGNDYYELRCNDCSAVLSFGQHKKGGTLFPKRKDDDGKYLPNKGWHKWVPENNGNAKK